jgi:hypothetical protein
MNNEPKKTDGMAEVFDDIRNHIDTAEITSMREVLWKIATQRLCEKYGITGDAVIAIVEEEVKEARHALDKTPLIAAAFQDAVIEFRKNAHDILP